MLAKQTLRTAATTETAYTLPRFQQLANATNRLSDVIALFNQAIMAGGGMNHQCCRLVLEQYATPLFGNAEQHCGRISGIAQSGEWDIESPLALPARGKNSETLLIHPIPMLIGDPLVISIGYDRAHDIESDRVARARLNGIATVYAHRALTLWEIEEDIETSAPLTLKERITLAMILSGHPYVDIAERLNCSANAVSMHIDAAITKLEAGDATAAVAISARRGWLHVPQMFEK